MRSFPLVLLAASLVATAVSSASPAMAAHNSEDAPQVTMATVTVDLGSLYEGNEANPSAKAKFAECMHQLNFPPKPLSVPSAYKLTLRVAAYAEGIQPTCQ